MKYTKAQRHRIYKKALEELRKHNLNYLGLCLALRYAINLGADYPMGFMADHFPEIHKQKPKIMHGYVGFWFPKNELGLKKRLAIVRKAIRQTAPKKKKE